MGQLPPARANGGSTGLDAHRLRVLIGFPGRCVKRHWKISTLVFLATIAASVLAALVLPRWYHVETKLLAQRNAVMLALGNPRRATPGDADSPTRLAAEAVRSRQNLLNIITSTHLAEDWNRIRSPAGRIKEELFVKFLNKSPVSRAERMDQLVELLLRTLWVQVGSEGADGTVTIWIDWFDPASAVRIVQQAQDNFIEERRAAEIARIAESIAILERHVDSAQTVITQAMSGAASVSQPAMIGEPRRTGAAASPLSTERDEVAVAIDAKTAVINDLENSRARRIADLQGQLSSMRGRYGPAHPEVQALQEQLAGLASDSPQLAALRADEAALQQRLRALGGAPRTSELRPDYSRYLAIPGTGLNPGRMYAESRLRMAIADYEDMSDRLKGANIELETARAAFKYRFTVLSPAKFPKEPSKPNFKLLAVGGLIAAFGLALFAAVGMDVTSGRLLESWQVDLLVGVPVIGRLHRE